MPICFTLPIIHGQDCLHTAPPPPRQMTPHPRGLSLGNLNVRDGRGSGLVQGIQEVQIGDFDLMILTETKIKYQDYCIIRMVYYVVCPLMSTTAADGVQG